MIRARLCNARASPEPTEMPASRGRVQGPRQWADTEYQGSDGASLRRRTSRQANQTETRWHAHCFAGAPMPLISIVLPTHRRAHLLETALRSVVNQVGFDDFEV